MPSPSGLTTHSTRPTSISYHYAVESPQVQNQYNGTVTLDANGEAVVDLPEYFSSVNTGPFQYQLTAIGAPGPNLYIAQEVTGNQFKIAGGDTRHESLLAAVSG